MSWEFIPSVKSSKSSGSATLLARTITPIPTPTISSSMPHYQPYQQQVHVYCNNRFEIILSCKMYFDKCMKYMGDGFYPVYNNDNTKYIFSSNILFRLSHKYPTMWQQMTDAAICGLDDITGNDLLTALNIAANVYVPYIVNCGGRQIYPTDLNNTTYKMLRSRNRSLTL